MRTAPAAAPTSRSTPPRAARRSRPAAAARPAPPGPPPAPRAAAPFAGRAAILAANRIVDKPYRYGGGHGRFEDTGYDCSGTVSYALNGAKLLDSPLASGAFMSWGRRGKGRWISVYAHGGHAYAIIAG